MSLLHKNGVMITSRVNDRALFAHGPMSCTEFQIIFPLLNMSEEMNRNYYVQHKNFQASVKINYYNLSFRRS